MSKSWLARVAAGCAGTLFGVTLTVVPSLGAPSEPPEATITAQRLEGSGPIRAGWTADVAASPDLVALRWDGDRAARYAIETRRSDGHWASVVEVEDAGEHAPDPGSAEAANARSGAASQPVWVGRARAVRVRLVSGTPRNVLVDRIDSPKAEAPTGVAGAATVPMPGIISRGQWGANENLRLANCPEGPDISTNTKMAVVHHTAGSNNYGPGDTAAIVRGLYGYATQTLKYCDTHYNFFVDRYGQIFEGRFGSIWDPVHAAHTSGMNTGTVGVAVIGNFSSTSVPAATRTALESLLAWKLTLHGVDPSRSVAYTTISGTDRWPAGSTHVLPFIVGHRDPGTTSCPGDRLYSLLPGIRSSVALRIFSGGADQVGGHNVEPAKPKVVVMHRDGSIYPAGGAPELRAGAVWPRWDIARDVEVVPSGAGGYTLDGFGGLHPFGFAASYAGAYWPGWDVARDLVLRAEGGGWVLDAFGGVHAFGGAPPLPAGPYWPGWDVARKLVRFDAGWYVMDAWGGLHGLGSAPRVEGPYWPGWQIARDVVRNPDGSGGYLLDGFGGVHPLGGAPGLAVQYFGQDVAQGIVVLSGRRGYTVRIDGSLAGFGGAPLLSQSRYTWRNAQPITTPWLIKGVAGVE